MNYSIKMLSDLAGVSTRTLRYYDKIDLLKPDFINASGYRVYGAKQVDLLQQILFFRELRFSLKEIHEMLSSPDFNLLGALTEQHKKLNAEKERLERLIATVEKTLASQKGETIMTDHEKFEGFKKEKLAQNEKRYGKEIRKKYGEDVVEKSNKQFANLSKDDYEASMAIQNEMFQNLQEALNLNDPASTPAQKAADLHRQWLCYFWPKGTYSKEAHAGLAQMYVDDPRFTSYYESKVAKGAAKMLRDAVKIYTANV
ncbi:MerR family transcriptional regulator [Sporolactobacillus nakayamae]|uniref:DNA-binding transcriptional regulator, MerR family n=1 Tax=Sporolactobacillus nakayamae TaxID=269670 RepID=A0A1I2PEZ5_9BACL|nr:MerR family transcriptional regulator [Sporolactobacillus nakayamae]SFG14715.1 DNA-binding transcriptional regulator, MerR family [Sporolactobacillus nakayamae]